MEDFSSLMFDVWRKLGDTSREIDHQNQSAEGKVELFDSLLEQRLQNVLNNVEEGWCEDKRRYSQAHEKYTTLLADHKSVQGEFMKQKNWTKKGWMGTW